MANSKGYVAKVCLLGDPAVGKTSLIRRFVYGTFEGTYLTTIGTNISRKDVVVDNGTVTLIIWDIAGQMRVNQITPMYYQGAMGAIAVVDITRRMTFDSIPLWVKRFREVNPNAIVILAANKTDLMALRAVAEEELRALASNMGLPLVYTSAKTGAGVDDMFRKLALEVLRHG